MARHAKIIMVGAFPPPVHGLAAVNAAVRDSFIQAGVKPVVLDVSAKSLNRSFISRLDRLPKVVWCLLRLVFSRRLRDCTFYMSISGGYGQFYEVLILAMARLRGMRLYLHHHSFAYLDRPCYLTRILTVVAGFASVHITLSSGMAALLQKHYPAVSRFVPISNAIFFDSNNLPTDILRSRLKTIGFISNISAEKGILEFLDLVEACESYGLPLRAKIAGPFSDAVTEEKVMNRLVTLGTVEYVGPKYGQEKERFFSTIDALIFPTLYENEAEPLTIHEAMKHNLPVIAYGRGCIPEIVASDCGGVVAPVASFVSQALALIKHWLDNPEVFRLASASAHNRFLHVHDENINRWQALMNDMISATVTASGSGNMASLENQSSHT